MYQSQWLPVYLIIILNWTKAGCAPLFLVTQQWGVAGQQVGSGRSLAIPNPPIQPNIKTGLATKPSDHMYTRIAQFLWNKKWYSFTLFVSSHGASDYQKLFWKLAWSSERELSLMVGCSIPTGAVGTPSAGGGGKPAVEVWAHYSLMIHSQLWEPI